MVAMGFGSEERRKREEICERERERERENKIIIFKFRIVLQCNSKGRIAL